MPHVPPVGANVFAHQVFPGMIIELGGRNFDVGKIVKHYDSFTFYNGGGYDPQKVGYADRVKVAGYFNP